MHTPAPLSQLYVATPTNISLGVWYRQIGIIIFKCVMCLLAAYIKFYFRVHFKLVVCTVEQGAKGKILMLDGGGRLGDSLSTV